MRNLIPTTRLNWILAVIFFLQLSVSYAATAPLPKGLIAAATVIPNLDKTIAQVKHRVNISVLFPTIVPGNSTKHYFANSDSTLMKDSYRINIDDTKSCNGMHVCNAGYVTATQGDKLQSYYDRNNKLLTISITLANHTKGYFTSGHNMADYFPATMQWQNDGVLYTICWDTTQNLLTQVANSAINAGTR